eukprot:TRINITY_DN187_c0_g1_i1.p1 TRINITY_DN187_c0_g1~~TRINITY_DN187_c0_g1_i1.p1  ORF type:complete len:238 (-),score=48.72 TRINITY_DN187_c0_g1_i1:89-802(-)
MFARSFPLSFFFVVLIGVVHAQTACNQTSPCPANKFCLHRWGNTICVDPVAAGGGCTTSGSRGFQPAPCVTGTYCEIIDPGRPEVDIPNKGICSSIAAKCSQPGVTGPCKARFTKYEYSNSTGKCVPFIYGGCAGYVPFNTIEECQLYCERKDSIGKPCDKETPCPSPLVCTFSLGGTACKKKLTAGRKCTTSGTLGFEPIPCDTGLTCKITDPGRPEIDIPNSGYCASSPSAVSLN